MLPEQIATTDWLLRRYDAHTALAAITESFERLHQWMPWATEPPTLSDEQEYLASATQR